MTTLLLTFTGGHLAKHLAVNPHSFMSNIDKVVSADYMGPQKIVFALIGPKLDWIAAQIRIRDQCTAVGSHDSGIYLRIGCTRINIVATMIKMTKTMTKAEEEQSAQWHCFKMSQSENSRNLKAFCSSSHQDRPTMLTIMVTMAVMMLTMLTI